MKSETKTEYDYLSLKERENESFKDKNGLFPHEILVIAYADKFSINQKNFKEFRRYIYRFIDIRKVLEDMQTRDFIKVGSIASTLKNETVASLKEELKKNGMITSGNKEKMIERLLLNANVELLEKRFTKRYYELTDKGRKTVKENEYIKYIHKHKLDDLNIWSLNRLMNDNPKGLGYRDLIWGYLNQKSMEYISNREYDMYNHCRHQMYKFLLEENRPDNAIKMLIEVSYYDLSGLCSGFVIDIKEDIRRYAFPYSQSQVRLKPTTIKEFAKYKTIKGLSDSEFKEMIIDHINKFSMKLHIFTIEECADIVLNEINENIDELSNIYSNSEQRFNELI